MTTFSVHFEDECGARVALKAIEGDIAALHNHIASAIENPAHWGEGRAAQMVRELRVKQAAAASIRKAFYEKHGNDYKIGSWAN